MSRFIHNLIMCGDNQASNGGGIYKKGVRQLHGYREEKVRMHDMMTTQDIANPLCDPSLKGLVCQQWDVPNNTTGSAGSVTSHPYAPLCYIQHAQKCPLYFKVKKARVVGIFVTKLHSSTELSGDLIHPTVLSVASLNRPLTVTLEPSTHSPLGGTHHLDTL